jgi:hypothetical protein
MIIKDRLYVSHIYNHLNHLVVVYLDDHPSGQVFLRSRNILIANKSDEL